METPSIDEIAKKLSACSLDARKGDRVREWQSLHSWARRFMEQNSLSAADFLDLCGIANSASNRQYLLPSGVDRVPSSVEGSKGCMLFDALRMLKSNPKKASQSKPKTPIEEIRLEYTKSQVWFLENGVVACFFSIVGNTLHADVIYKRKDFQEREVLAKIEDLTTHSISCDFQEHIDACDSLCLVVNNCYASGSLFGRFMLEGREIKLGVTAAHVFRPSEPGTIHWQQVRERVSLKYERGAIPMVHLGEHVECPNIPGPDVAFFVALDSVSIPMSFEWDHNLDQNSLAEGQVVYKDGVATSITKGRITRIEDGAILVESSVVGPFAYPGDSGALVKTEDGKVVGCISTIEIIRPPEPNAPLVHHVMIVPSWEVFDFFERALRHQLDP